MRGYIHGFGPAEEQRLRDQAGILAPVVFAGMDLPDQGLLVELGCGVGAELDLVADRHPGLNLLGVDLSPTHVTAAHAHVTRAHFVNADATALPFPDACADVVMTVWLLEHVPDPVAVLAEARRILRPGGLLWCSEVDNDTFRFDPPMPAIADWWDRFNHRQQLAGGDPFVGRRLSAIAGHLGFEACRTSDLAVVASRERPAERRALLDYVSELLLSGAAALVDHGLSDPAGIAVLRDEFAHVATNPAVEFEYHAVRLTAVAP